MLLVLEPIFPLIQTQEDYLRNVQARVVLRNDFFLRLLERVLADEWFYVGKGAAGELRPRFCKGLEFIE